MGKHNVVELSGRDAIRDELTNLIREGVSRLIREAVEGELAELLASLSGRQDADGRAAVVRNGYHPKREIQTGVGPVAVRIPKVRGRDGKPVRFHSTLVPPYVRKSASLQAAIPWLYLKGISTGDMAPALEVLVGAEAKGLSASTLSRLKQQWGEEYTAWRHRRLDRALGVRVGRRHLQWPAGGSTASVQPKAKSALHDIWQAPTRIDADRAFDRFLATCEAKYPKATQCLQKDRDTLMTFYDFPAVHWQHLRTTNPIESTFATIRHRTDRAKGCVTRTSVLHMMFKLGQCAEHNWRKLRGFAYLAKVIDGVKFVDGEEVNQPNRVAA